MVLPIVIPVIFWAGYHYHKDRHLPEPALNLAVCFGLGMAAMGLSKFLYLGLEPLGLRYDALELGAQNAIWLLAYSVMAIGPIEEFSKLLPFLLIVIRFKALDEPMDGIIYASFLALGYAAAENFYYLQFLTPMEAAARGFASPVVHMVFASVWAHWITRARLAHKPLAGAVLAGFSLAALLHGIYDFLVLLQPIVALPIAAALIIAIWIWRLMVMRHYDRGREGSGDGP